MTPAPAPKQCIASSASFGQQVIIQAAALLKLLFKLLFKLQFGWIQAVLERPKHVFIICLQRKCCQASVAFIPSPQGEVMWPL
jgi:hypothetical protein